MTTSKTLTEDGAKAKEAVEGWGVSGGSKWEK
jgi:hypothetical protein